MCVLAVYRKLIHFCSYINSHLFNLKTERLQSFDTLCTHVLYLLIHFALNQCSTKGWKFHPVILLFLPLLIGHRKHKVLLTVQSFVCDFVDLRAQNTREKSLRPSAGFFHHVVLPGLSHCVAGRVEGWEGWARGGGVCPAVSTVQWLVLMS